MEERFPLRSRDRAGSAAGGARTLRPRRWPAARGRDGAAAIPMAQGRRPTDHAGILADPRSRGAALAEEHRSDLPRRRVSRDGAARTPDPDPDPDGDVRTAGEGVERQGRDDRAGPRLRGAREAAAPRTFPGTSAVSTTVTARRRTAGSSPISSIASCPQDGKLTTNAHPLVEMTMMEQPARGRTLDSPRERHRPPRHRVLSAAGDPRHPHRPRTRRPPRACRRPRSGSSDRAQRAAAIVHGAQASSLRGHRGRVRGQTRVRHGSSVGLTRV